MKFDETRETYGKIATLYYMGELSQDEIAKIFNISRFKVSRVLKRCKELNIIEFRVNNKPHYYKSMETQIIKGLDIKKCIIVNPGTTALESKTNVGKAGAKYLADRLKDGMLVGLDWGTTLQTMVREFSPDQQYHDSLFVQISGSTASQSVADNWYMDGHDIVKSLAAKAGAQWSLFPVPYIVKDKVLRDMLLEEKTIKNHIDYFKKLDIAFFGISSFQPEVYVPFYKNYLSTKECNALRKVERFGELVSCPLDEQGNMVDSILKDRVMTIDPALLKVIPETVVLAAGKDKVNSLVAAARGGYFKTMVTTEVVALSILELLEREQER
ncbi:MAG: sugar-binding domain-containing protein [Christensenella sp.]|uniref:sugar-binding transcriptional regulator n=1 Tax=Christensenella sp. TaxID=1935934 RepID=UPI002B2072C2|nr:sugar-binding domain-containing protein [Christensenella sp.]MEA5003150.1 sugar-binding domain-containing protein [Christensenella sp.]